MKKNVAEFLEFRFEKLKLLKRSERGEVWLAKARQGGDLVIIKRVALTGLPYDLIKKFSFKLPAKVLYCAEDEAETVIVEEFIQGENLSARKNPLSEIEAREILLQMCDGLRELHEQKIIHRDIKPSNLILQSERIRLIDFDAARIFKDGKEVDTKLLGTKGYAPPEQYGSGQTDSRSDIYSLGVTMKTLLGKNCGGHLKKILDKCTELDPKNRFQNVDELKSALTFEEPRSPLKIFPALIVIGFFLFANASPLNRDENFTEEVVEKIILEETPAPDKISESAQIKEFKLPEIVTPPRSEIIMPNVEPPKEYKPPPRQIFSEEDLKLPTIPLPTEPSYEPPPNFNSKPRQTFSGMLKTSFYLNGNLFNQFEHISENIKISRSEWLTTQARLHITNDTGEVWRNPKIKFIIGQNWGDGKVTETKSLPSLNVGESADFVIPFNLLAVSDRKNTYAYIQIWLEGDKSKMDEHYWGASFDIVD